MSTDVARRPPVVAVEQYTAEFATVLPERLPAEVFSRLAVGALRRDPQLMQAATKNLPSFMHALMEAAKLGLEPGSEEYWLIPRGLKGGKQGPSVLGLVGWKGEIELILRTGAVRSVAAEVVRERDRFHYRPGTGLPVHEIDWFGDRGVVIGAWACAEMAGGGWSRAVVIGPEQIERAMAASATAGSSQSPWETDFAAMVLKTAVHRLADWVPTSPEYRREVLRASMDVAAEQRGTAAAVSPVPVEPPEVVGVVDEATGEIVYHTAEGPEPEPAQPSAAPAAPPVLDGPPAAKTQVGKIRSQIQEIGRLDGQPLTMDDGLALIAALAGIGPEHGPPLRAVEDLTAEQAAAVIAQLDRTIAARFEVVDAELVPEEDGSANG